MVQVNFLIQNIKITWKSLEKLLGGVSFTRWLVGCERERAMFSVPTASECKQIQINLIIAVKV